MAYEGFKIVLEVIILFGISYLLYYVIMNIDYKWSILIISIYIHCILMYISFFPIIPIIKI